MRWIFFGILIVTAAVLAGCLSTSSPVTPTPTQSVVVLTTPATSVPTTAVAGYMQINVTATQSGNDINVSYNGGPNAADLVALKITIYNQNGQVVRRTMPYPTPGDVYTFPYMGTPDPDNVDVIGIFTGGVEQTVLMSYI